MIRREFLKTALLSAGAIAAGTVDSLAASFVLDYDAATIWTQFPAAARYVGNQDCTYLGWISKNGHVRLGQLNHTTRAWRTVTLEARARNNTPAPDDHMATIPYIHTDGTVVAFFAGHDGKVVCRRSIFAEDLSGFGSEVSILAASGAYPRPVYIQSTLYCFYRKQISGADRDTCFKTSTNGGATWSSETTLINNGTRPYAFFRANGADRIDFACSIGWTADAGIVNSVYHFYFEPSTGKKYKTDGTEIGAGGAAIAISDMSLVYDGTTVEGFPHDIIGNGANDVSIAYATYPTPATDHRYNVAKWAGASWASLQVATGGPRTDDGTIAGGYYSGGMCFYDNGNTVICARGGLGAGTNEWAVQKYTLSGTWSLDSTLSAQDTTKRQRPVVPLNHHATDLDVVWMEGDYVHYEDFSTRKVGRLDSAADPSIHGGAPLGR